MTKETSYKINDAYKGFRVCRADVDPKEIKIECAIIRPDQVELYLSEVSEAVRAMAKELGQ